MAPIRFPIVCAAFALPLVACKGAAPTTKDEQVSVQLSSSTRAVARQSSNLRSHDNHEQGSGLIALQGSEQPALKFRAQMQNDAPSAESTQRPTSRAAVPVVSPLERPRVKRTLQLAEAYQEAAQRAPQGEMCTFARKALIKDAWGKLFKLVECDEAVGMSLQSAGPDETFDTNDDVRWEGFVSNGDLEPSVTTSTPRRIKGHIE